MNLQNPSPADSPSPVFSIENDHALPWDIYETHNADLTVLEGNWNFNSMMRVVLNGTTKKNGQPVEKPVTLEGIVRATRAVNGRVSYFLRSDTGRSADIYFVAQQTGAETQG